jgi:hypothetical protein
MCSVSWLINKSGYQIFFNRDEQKTRAKALPPVELNMGRVSVIMPIDPLGQGSWISTNDMGVSLCLLNNYQASNPNDVVLSRGLLLKELAKAESIEGVREACSLLNLRQFAPFSLLAFDLGICQQGKSVIVFEWNGVKCSIHPTDSPLFSSGMDLSNVTNYRDAVFRRIVGDDPTEEKLLAFHRHHHTEQPHMSVCMHRKDAETVSFTQVVVSEQSQEMRYVAGSPCARLHKQALPQTTLTLPSRRALVK